MRKMVGRNKRRRTAECIGVCFEPLEPRLLLSGSWAAGMDNPSPDPQPNNQDGFTQESGVLFESTGISGVDALQQKQSQPQTGTIVDILASAPAIEEFAAADPAPQAAISEGQTPPAPSGTPTASVDDVSGSASDSVPKRELVFVNGNVADYEQLIADLRGSDDNRLIEVVVLDSNRDGIEQISEILAERSNLAAVHFITHGADGMISLGGSWLTTANLPQHNEAIAKWGEALTETGDILFYGCNIAADNAGQGLLDDIAKLTGADVAASTDLTGNTLLGADWELEYATDRIEARIAVSAELQRDWFQVMAVSLDNVSNRTSSNASTITLSHTTGSGTDRLLVVGIDIKENISVTSVTYGGVNLTLAGVANNAGNARAEIWYLKMPATGTADVVVNITGNSDIVIGAATYNGVNQTTPLGTFVSNTGSTITSSVIASSASGEWVFDTMAVRDASSITVGAGQTQQWNNGFANFRGGSSTEPGAASVTMSWTLDVAKNWAIAAVPIKAAATGPTTFVVTNTNNSGAGSLRQAILDANANTGTDTIVFNIPLTDANHVYYRDNGAAGFSAPVSTTLPDSAITDFDTNYLAGTARSWYSIALSGNDLQITEAVVIDGSTQAGYSASKGPIIEVNAAGVTAGDPNAFTIQTSGVTIRGLAINRAADDAIEIDAFGGGHTIVGNYIGTDVSGLRTTYGNGYGITVKTDGNTIGGPSPADRNVIAGNSTLADSFGIGFWQDADSNVVQGNYIGVGADGTTAMSNRDGVIFAASQTTDNNLIGGTAPGAGNLIAGNSQNGITALSGTGNAFVGNTIHSNGLLGINLGTAGVTANDANDADTGTNNLQNFPVLSSVRVVSGTQLAVTGTLNSTASSYYRIEFFANTSADATGYGEGRRYLGFVNVSTDGSGNATFNTTLTATLAAGESVSATATKSDATFTTFTDTSEFSQNTVAFEGMALWRTNTDTSPNFQIWDGAAYSPAGSSVAIGDLKSMQVAESPTRTEVIVIGRTSGGSIVGEIWNGTSWGASTINPLGTQAVSSQWATAAGYESVSGDALLVWGDQATGLRFTTWNGMSWSASAVVSDYATISGGTAATKVSLASNRTSNEMVLAITDNLGRDYAFVWNGSSWGAGVQVGVNSTGRNTSSDVAYEAQSGRAVIVYEDSGSSVYYRIWNGTSWSAQASFAAPAGVTGGPNYINLASDPTSNRLAIAITPTGTAGSVQYWLNTWNGSAWGTALQATASGVDQLMPGIDVAFESTSGDALAAYGITGTSAVGYRTWTAAGGWSAEGTWGVGLTQPARVVTLTPDPDSDRIMMADQDGNSQLALAQWSGSARGAGTIIETNTGETNYQPFAFVWEFSANEAPVNTVPGLQVTAVSTPLLFSTGNGNAISVADSDDTSVSVTLTATNGLLTLSGLTGLSFSAGDGSADATMTFTGTLANVNAALNGLQFSPTTAFQGVATVQIATTDFGRSGASSPKSDTDSVTVEVGVVNHAPVNTVPAAQAIDVNGIALFSSATGTQISVSDADAGSNLIQVTLTAANGTINLSGNKGLTFTTGDGTADATMTFTGTVTDINAALNGMTFVAAANFVGTASVQIVTNDLGNSGAGGALSETDAVSLAVREVDKSIWMTSLNDVASPGASGLTSWTAGQVLKFGPSGGSLLFEPGTTTGTFSLAGFNMDNAGFSDGNTQIDSFYYVTRSMTVGGIALQRGDLLFSTVGNETIGGTSYEGGDVILFRPTTPGNYNAGTFSLFFDRGTSGITVTSFTLVEQATAFGDITLNAGDLLLTNNSARDILRYVATQLGATTSGTPSTLIDGDGNLGFGQDIAAVELVEQTSVIGNKTLPAGTLIVSLKGEDATVGSGTQIAVTRQDLFALSVITTGVGTTYATATPLFEGADVGLDTNNEAVQSATLIPNQAPTAGNQTFGLPENSANGTVVGTVSGTDPEGGTVKYAITAGNSNGAFTINASTGQITVANTTALDYETTPSFNLTVAAIDPDGAYGTATATINLSDLNEANDPPTFTTGAGTGKVTTNVSSFWDGASATLIQPDGKIVVAGSMNNGSTVEPYVARYNADGTLDPSFGPAGNGIYSFSIQPSNDGLYAMALQSDGKILVAGYAHNGMNNDFAIVRFNTDGSLDTTFDSDGIRLIDIAGDNDTARGIAVQSDGKIVVGGVAAVAGNNDFAVVRLNADGSLDASFGTGGKITTAIGAGADEARGLAIQTDGKIVLTGYSHNGTNEDVALVRYNTDGSLDTNFDGDGKRTLAIGSGYDVANAVALQSDGKIVVAGDSLISGTPDFTVMRFNADGSLDTSFDADGIAITAVGGSSDYSKALAIQSDGRIVVVGESFNGSNNDIAVVRYNSDGSLDTTFDTDGKLTTAIGSSIDTASGVAVQSDGKIVVAGFAQFADGYTALVRYNTNGSLDTTFGATSTLNGAPTYVENGAPVVLDADVQVTDPELGAAGNYSGATLTLSRHGGANSQDTFSATGNLSALTQGGNLVLSGVTIGTVTTNSGGTLLLTFNGSATQARVNETLRSIAYANSSDAPPASAQINWTFNDGNSGTQGPGGSFVVTGSTTVTITAVNDAPGMPAVSLGLTNEDVTKTWLVSSFTSGNWDADTGALKGLAIVGADNSNGTWQYTLNGTDWFNIGSVSASNALLLAADATTAFRFVPNANWNGTTGLLQYKAWDQTSGTAGTYVDASVSGGTTAFGGTNGSSLTVSAVNDAPTFFSGTGMLPISFGAGTSSQINATAVQADGKIIAVGQVDTASGRDTMLMRYNADGSLDTSFGGGTGMVVTAVGVDSNFAKSVTLLDGGKILVAGTVYTGFNPDIFLARYNSDGTLDTSFDSDGIAKSGLGLSDEGFSMAVLSDGKILVAGTAFSDFVVVKFNSNGTLDATFGSGGSVVTDFAGSTDLGEGLVVQSDGKFSG